MRSFEQSAGAALLVVTREGHDATPCFARARVLAAPGGEADVHVLVLVPEPHALPAEDRAARSARAQVLSAWRDASARPRIRIHVSSGEAASALRACQREVRATALVLPRGEPALRATAAQLLADADVSVLLADPVRVESALTDRRSPVGRTLR